LIFVLIQVIIGLAPKEILKQK